MSELKEKIDVLNNINFSSEEEFNIEENYALVENFKAEREDLKSKEAENTLEDLAPKYINVKEFQDKKDNLRNFMRKFSAEKELIQNMSEEEKDKLYKIANYLYNNFALSLNDINFSLIFTYDEAEFIVKTLNHKLEYSSEEVFQMVKFKNETYDKFQDELKRNKNTDIKLTTNISNIVLFYHLINKYKTLGINKQFELFVSVLNKIGESNQVFNALNIIKERLNQEFITWTTSITPEEKIVEDTTEQPK